MLIPNSSGRVRVFLKRKLRLDLLDFDQKQMYRLGDFGVTEVLSRIAKGQGPEDSPAKPLGKGYAIRKTKAGLGNRRNLRFKGLGGGHMLDNLKVRTVSKNEAQARFSVLWAREKAEANTAREPFMLFSPRNQKQVAAMASRLLIEEKLPRLIQSTPNN